jgi:hypothetical protein
MRAAESAARPDGADDRSASVNSDGGAKEVVRRGARDSEELLLLDPAIARADEDVSRTLPLVRADGVIERPDDGDVTRDRKIVTEGVAGSAVGRVNLRRLCPRAPGALEHGHRALGGVRTDGVARATDERRRA